jgi:ectoine hydroxylase-related dioxygenase (phytanoyl-CoA dioxygenase family)
VRVDQRDLAERGYIVVGDVAPEPLLAAAREAIAAFLGVDFDPQRPHAWYPAQPLECGVVPLHHSQAQWDLRQLPQIHAVFAAILQVCELWVSMDRAVCRLPASDDHPEHVDRSVIHWDLDPRTAPVPTIQGMLFLTDTPADQGPFECVPGLFADVDRWLGDHPHHALGAPIDLEGHETVPVPVRAGDLVVWDARLPHRGAPNRGHAPRLSLPITMWRVGSEEDRSERIRCWRQRRAQGSWRDWPGIVDPEPGEPAALTQLGRRLVGLEDWPCGG